jgi:tetratricopeptide (TPR) repeat protein
MQENANKSSINSKALTMKSAGKLFFLFFLLVAGSWVRADFIEDGKAAFAKGDYPAAINAFKSALSTRGPSAGLYYSLAMAEQKSGERAQAALNLRRAIMLDPQMMDARMALSEIERSQGVPAVRSGWRELLTERAPVSAFLIAGCALTWLGAFLLLAVVFASAGRLLPLVGALGLTVTGVGLFLFGYLADPRVSERDVAVVCEKGGISVLSAPADQSATVTRLPGAAPVRILGQSGEWTFCAALAGEKGWAPSKSLEPVVPAA